MYRIDEQLWVCSQTDFAKTLPPPKPSAPAGYPRVTPSRLGQQRSRAFVSPRCVGAPWPRSRAAFALIVSAAQNRGREWESIRESTVRPEHDLRVDSELARQCLVVMGTESPRLAADPPAGLARVGLAGQVQPPRGQQQRHVVTAHSEGAPGLGGAPECCLLCACGCPPGPRLLILE